jgi:cytochrome c553
LKKTLTMKTRHFALLAFLAAGVASRTVRAADANPAGVEYFERNVRPVLADNCYRCHSNSATKVRGDLYLDTVSGILKGGEDGPVIMPGDPDHSPLISAIRREDKDTQMPPKQALTESQVAVIVNWVKMGAPGPKDMPVISGQPVTASGAPVHDPTAEYPRLRKQLWSWQPIKTGIAPTGPDQAWARDDIDLYVLAKQEEKDLHPSPDADKPTLIRRATFDLIGVPPTPQEIDAFVRDSSSTAFEKVVDRLLASPHFGERWGRHWLDVARYAESTGMTRNLPYYYAWRYRDYVIAAFNSDKPYNRFLTEQLAGDQLPANSPAERDQLTIATGFLALGTKDFNEKNPQQFLMNNVDEQIDVTGRAILATTISCARCHDHKFDPIPTKEYYGLAGIFRSTQTFTGLRRARPKMVAQEFDNDFLLPLSGYRGGVTTSADDAPTVTQPRRLRNQKAGAKGQQYAGLFTPIKEEPLAMGAKDVIYPSDTNVLVRGDLDNVGPLANRGFLTIPCMATTPTVINPSHSGRLELAEWITREDNPLTSRVVVNRIWRHLFGEGIVRSVDNFGMSGEQPDNPELLDYLASDFMKNGWSIKKMIRQIMLSSTYRQASTLDPEKFATDPDNRLMWRQNQRRLEAESIRDSILSSAGDLNASPMYGSVVLKTPPAQILRSLRKGGLELGDVGNYRSIYLPIYRAGLPEVLDTFDVADPDFVTGDREVTTVAPQALFMMNSPFVLDQAGRMAARLESESRAGLSGEVDLAYRLAVGRQANNSEHSRAVAFINSFARDDRSAGGRSMHDGLAAFCQALFASAEFRYVN